MEDASTGRDQEAMWRDVTDTVYTCDEVPPRVSAHWTVKDPGTTTPPSSDDYSVWTVVQLRKECTSRKLRLSRKTSAADRVKRLLAFDEAHLAIVGSVLGSAPDGEAHSPLHSKNCCFRLLNVLFSDLFASRFAEIGNSPTRQQLDVGDVNVHSSFWRDVTTEFNENRTDYNQLICSNARFSGVEPSVFVSQEVSTLFDKWKSVNRKYLKAMAKFTKSGEHDDDFYAFCAGSLEVYYLRECLELKRDLTGFVEGGLLHDDEFDSLKRDRCSGLLLQSPPSKKVKSDLVDSVKTLTAKLPSVTKKRLRLTWSEKNNRHH